MPTNLLASKNSRFDGALTWWTGTAVYDSGGFPRNGSAHIASGNTLESYPVSVSVDQPYTVHLFAMIDLNALLTVSYGGQTIAAFTGDLDTPVWVEYSTVFMPNTNDTEPFVFGTASGNAVVDTVTVIHGLLPIMRMEIAATVAGQLSALATDAALSLMPISGAPEGDYTFAVDDALRSVSALDMYGTPDVTLIEPTEIGAVIDSAYGAMLQQVRADYALDTDVTLGPRSERRSQIAASIDAMLGGGGGGGSGGSIAVRELRRDAMLGGGGSGGGSGGSIAVRELRRDASGWRR